MKAVMYHYVQGVPVGYPNFRYLHIDDFKRQLDYFSREFGFVERAAFLKAVATGDLSDCNGVILTFDDGLACHAQAVYPELVARGLWGIFYVSTGPYATQRILDVHRIHLLLGRCQFPDALLADLRALIAPEMLVAEHVDTFKTTTYALQSSDASTLQIKRILNYFISYEWREKIVSALIEQQAEHNVPFPSAQEFYLSVQDMLAMQAGGMLIGSHSITHRVFSKLRPDEQKQEIDGSLSTLEQMVGPLAIRTFCYPYGDAASFTAVTEQLLNQAGSMFSFSTIPGDIDGAALKTRPQALPRYDCNQFPFGKAH